MPKRVAIYVGKVVPGDQVTARPPHQLATVVPGYEAPWVQRVYILAEESADAFGLAWSPKAFSDIRVSNEVGNRIHWGVSFFARKGRVGQGSRVIRRR